MKPVRLGEQSEGGANLKKPVPEVGWFYTALGMQCCGENPPLFRREAEEREVPQTEHILEIQEQANPRSLQ